MSGAHWSQKESSDYTYIPYTKYVTPCSHVCSSVDKILCIILLLISFYVVYYCLLRCSNFIFVFFKPCCETSRRVPIFETGRGKKKGFSGKHSTGQCAVHISLKNPFSFKPFHSSVIYMWSCYLKGFFSMLFIFFWDEEYLTVRSFHIYNTIIFSVQFPWTENLQISKVIYCKWCSKNISITNFNFGLSFVLLY